MFAKRREEKWKMLNEWMNAHYVANLKDGRVDDLMFSARMNWDSGKERLAIKQLDQARAILMRNIVILRKYDHIKDGVSDCSDSKKIRGLNDRFEVQMANGNLRGAERTLKKLAKERKVSAKSGAIGLELKRDDDCGAIAVVHNYSDEPITVREIKLRAGRANGQSLYCGLSTVDSRSSDCYPLTTDPDSSEEVYCFYERKGKSYTLVASFDSGEAYSTV